MSDCQNNHTTAFIRILTNHVNAGLPVDVEKVCEDIAVYVHAFSRTPTEQFAVGQALSAFCCDYGEEKEYLYLGRDEDGEKSFTVTNQKTNWEDKINKTRLLLKESTHHGVLS